MTGMTSSQRLLYTMLRMNLHNGHACETSLEGTKLLVTKDGASIGYIDLTRGDHYLTDAGIVKSLRQANLIFN